MKIEEIGLENVLAKAGECGLHKHDIETIDYIVFKGMNREAIPEALESLRYLAGDRFTAGEFGEDNPKAREFIHSFTGYIEQILKGRK